MTKLTPFYQDVHGGPPCILQLVCASAVFAMSSARRR